MSIFNKRKVIPVVIIDNPNDVAPLMDALLEGGIDIIEITLRTKVAFRAIEIIHKLYPEVILGAGTVITTEQARQVRETGVSFAVSPSLNTRVADFFHKTEILFIPGIMTPSEIDLGISLGCKLQKFFPAHINGGAQGLKALSEPFLNYNIKFCPTGGINLDNMSQYLSLENVFAVGGSWIATRELVRRKAWRDISLQAKKARDYSTRSL